MVSDRNVDFEVDNSTITWCEVSICQMSKTQTSSKWNFLSREAYFMPSLTTCVFTISAITHYLQSIIHNKMTSISDINYNANPPLRSINIHQYIQY